MANPLYDTLLGRHEGAETPFLSGPQGDWTHARFLDLAARIAGALASMGLQPGDRVAIQAEKSAEALALIAACIRRGLVFLPLNTAYTPAELVYFVTDAGARLLVCDPSKAGALSGLAERCETLGADGSGSLLSVTAPPAEAVARSGDDLAALLYTSGTTGRSKGAMLSQDNLLSNARTLVEAWHFSENDVLIHALPIFHTHGLFVAVNVTLLAGGSMVFLPTFDAGAILDAMPAATALMGVPTFYTRLLADERLTPERAASMRLFVSGSAPLLSETHRAWEARTGHRILERYGMTETNMNTSNPYDGERRPGTVGPALPGVEVRVMGEGGPLPAGETGDVEVRGPNVFQGYWGMPEKTAEDLRSDGFFRTGDLGQMDGDGYLTIVGREKDLVISGGFNIYPREVEEAIDALDGVLESAVIAAPHADLGEAAVAVVVPVDGADLQTGDLDTALQQSLARYKCPRAWVLASELPRNTMGKVQKAALREAHRDIFG